MINTDIPKFNDTNLIQKEEKAVENTTKHPNESTGIYIRGHIKIFDPDSGKVFIDKSNAIHYENFSVALANSIADKSQNFIYEMNFGNGGTSVDPTGIITYLPTNTVGQNANLYNPTYSKIIDDTAIANPNPANNKKAIDKYAAMGKPSTGGKSVNTTLIKPKPTATRAFKTGLSIRSVTPARSCNTGEPAVAARAGK